MTTLISAKQLWSDTEPERPLLIMGNSASTRLYEHSVYDDFFTLGCNSRLHKEYTPDLTLMVDDNIPDPTSEYDIASHRAKWQKQHNGTCYTYQLGKNLKFHPDISTDKIDFSITSPYMAIIFGYHMGYRNFTLIGIDLCEVNGVDRIDTPIADPGVSAKRAKMFMAFFNHLSFLINKMSRYYDCQFFSLSPHSQLLNNGYVKKVSP